MIWYGLLVCIFISQSVMSHYKLFKSEPSLHQICSVSVLEMLLTRDGTFKRVSICCVYTNTLT